MNMCPWYLQYNTVKKYENNKKKGLYAEGEIDTWPKRKNKIQAYD